ncbi:EsaB/YukD family protein [Listeria costaricensis]|uniref:EsaB/YukD family protein n=1 Tax=Listeria costaricensis TaxID=2026604 RepID=UPI000C070C97|nr:EsaB/YukD family protein [Listeria costaricensis]
MAKETHIDVTVDLENWGAGQYDLRIPIHQPVKALIQNLAETLKIQPPDLSSCTIKTTNKAILLSDDDKLTDFQITSGDILKIL